MNTSVSPEFYWIAFALVLIVSAARITRLIVFDSLPPVVAVRMWWFDRMDGGPKRRAWQKLFFCGWCMSFWVSAALLVWADLAGVLDDSPAFGWSGDLSRPLWWVVNGAFATAYAAAMVMVRDGDESDSEND